MCIHRMDARRDLGHSQLASYILSEMYVADLPLIERHVHNPLDPKP